MPSWVDGLKWWLASPSSLPWETESWHFYYGLLQWWYNVTSSSFSGESTHKSNQICKELNNTLGSLCQPRGKYDLCTDTVNCCGKKLKIYVIREKNVCPLRRLNIINMAVLLTLTYRFSIVTFKLSADFFVKGGELIVKIYMNIQENSQNNRMKKDDIERHTFWLYIFL